MKELKTGKACHIEIVSSTYSLSIIVDKSVEKKALHSRRSPFLKKEKRLKAL
jgi:hypothetical protein